MADVIFDDDKKAIELLQELTQKELEAIQHVAGQISAADKKELWGTFSEQLQALQTVLSKNTEAIDAIESKMHSVDALEIKAQEQIGQITKQSTAEKAAIEASKKQALSEVKQAAAEIKQQQQKLQTQISKLQQGIADLTSNQKTDRKSAELSMSEAKKLSAQFAEHKKSMSAEVGGLKTTINAALGDKETIASIEKFLKFLENFKR